MIDLRKLVALFVSCFISINLTAQCNIDGFASPNEITCGECVELSAFGSSTGNIAFSEDFNNGQPNGWQFTQAASYNNPCSPGGVDGTPHMWMGDASVNPRDMETVSLDLTLGGTICFDMLFAVQGDASPCEGPDEPDEGVYLQYSTDGGLTWITIHYFDPNGGNDPQLTNWNNYCFPLPPGALTANTMIRWHQDDVSGAEYDHWGIDNVVITLNDPTFDIIWQHDNYNHGSAGGVNPTPVCPTQDTSYVVYITNGTVTCYDTVDVSVNLPNLTVDAGSDTSICPGECVDLNGYAHVLVSPAQTPTYENNQVEVINGGMGATTAVNINVQGLNMNSVLPNSITEVCINNLTYFGTGFSGFPPTPVNEDIGSFNIYLQCPNGTQILLVPSGTTSGSATSGYSQTCFVPAGGAAISSGSAPYTGQWASNEPFNNLSGCDANGVWSLVLESTTGLGFGAGTFTGWSISFDDPELSYTPNYSWSPNGNMTNSTSLSPNVCPGSTETYTLTASDTAGCVTMSDDVTVTVLSSCCSHSISATVVDPTCGGSNGGIDLTISGGTGPYTFDWGGGITSEDLSGIAAGSYSVSITDQGTGCVADTTIVLSSPGGAVIDSIAQVDPSCGASDGELTIMASGGNGALSYSVDNGATFQATSAFANLPAGTYTIVVEDASGCQITQQVTLNNAAAPVIDNIVTTDPSCGASDGSIVITASGGSGVLNYSIDGGINYQAAGNFGNLGAGTFDVVVEDASGCQVSQQVVLSNSGGVEIDTVIVTHPTCGLANGTIDIVTTGGTAPYQFSSDNGGTFQAGSSFTGLSGGNYTIVVEDANGCQDSEPVVLNVSSAPVIDSVSTVNPPCGSATGTITIAASGGTGGYTYSIDNGATFQSSDLFQNLNSGNYSIVVEDGNGCQVTSSASLSNPGAPVIDNVGGTDPLCNGSGDGSILITATGGVAPLSYSIDNGLTFQSGNTFSGVSAGNYSIVVEDANGCQASTSFVLNEPSPLEVNIIVSDLLCFRDSTGNIEVVPTGGDGNYQVDMGNGFQSAITFSNMQAGTYNLIVVDGNGCSLDTIAVVNEPDELVLDLNAFDAICNGECDGNAIALPSGGSVAGLHTFTWSGNIAGTSDAQASNLCAGNYSLAVTDDNGCLVDTTFDIAEPAPVLIDQLSWMDETCIGDCDGELEVQAGNASSFSIDGGVTFQASGQFTGLCSGSYVIQVQDAVGCSTDTVVTIQGNPYPVADFVVNNETLTTLNSTVSFNNTSSGAVSFFWNFGGIDSAYVEDPTFEFPGEPDQTYQVCLEAINAFGCADVYCTEIEIENEYTIYVPNAFSPDGDGLNDYFNPLGVGLEYEDYTLWIFNRWGELIFETSNPGFGWDGTYQGELVKNDVYVWKVKLKDIGGTASQRLEGHVTVVR